MHHFTVCSHHSGMALSHYCPSLSLSLVRSCVLVGYRGRCVMLDCGVHPGETGMGRVPLFDGYEPGLATVDMCLITHFHLDHCGALPYLVSTTEFDGKILMTPATKAVCKLVWRDYCKVSGHRLYEESAVDLALAKSSTINFREETEYRGIKTTCYGAGHVVGACMFLIEIAGVRVLYTGMDASMHPFMY
eukprot:GHVU01067862.1.p1 GENE.GHVU01067862.1~~GHVU01067862.1.p1  ORF type:complete len:190 (-),score=32.56 GHVU01067862.1:152-721(-)